jgi:hypothetical protein
METKVYSTQITMERKGSKHLIIMVREGSRHLIIMETWEFKHLSMEGKQSMEIKEYSIQTMDTL